MEEDDDALEAAPPPAPWFCSRAHAMLEEQPRLDFGRFSLAPLGFGDAERGSLAIAGEGGRGAPAAGAATAVVLGSGTSCINRGAQRLASLAES